jgi:hypothetical protein
MQATVVATRGSRALVTAAIACLALGAVVLGIGAIAGAPSGHDVRVPLASIPEGASLQHIADRGIVLVRTGTQVRAFAPWDGRGDALVLCPRTGVFATAVFASRYRFDGTKIGGPGPGPLASHETRIQDGDLVINLSHRFDQPLPRWSDGMPSVFTGSGGGICP